MVARVNGKSGIGALVVPRSSKYTIEVQGKGKIDLFSLASCHREFTAEKNASGFVGENGFKYEYDPSLGIEDSGHCPIQIAGFEEQKGRHSWVYLDIDNGEATLPARLVCNGVTQSFGGVSICQSKRGLIQRIEFDGPVKHAKSVCAELKTSDSKSFEYAIPKSICVWVFKEWEGGRIHRHTTIGYEGTLIRGN
jgi:hypothetical protein